MTKLCSIKDVADYFGVPVSTIYQWRYRGYGPPGKRVGRYVRYREEDVIDWFDAITDPAA